MTAGGPLLAHRHRHDPRRRSRSARRTARCSRSGRGWPATAMARSSSRGSRRCCGTAASRPRPRRDRRRYGPGSLHRPARGARDREGLAQPSACPIAGVATGSALLLRRPRPATRPARSCCSSRPGRRTGSSPAGRPPVILPGGADPDSPRASARRGGPRRPGARRRGRAGRGGPGRPRGGAAGRRARPGSRPVTRRPREARPRVRDAAARRARALPATSRGAQRGRVVTPDARPADPADDGRGPARRPAHRARLLHDALAGPRLPPGARDQPPRPLPRGAHRRADRGLRRHLADGGRGPRHDLRRPPAATGAGGIGERLLLALLDLAVDRHAREATLEVRLSNLPRGGCTRSTASGRWASVPATTATTRRTP